MVAVLQERVELVEAGDFRRQNERLGLPVQCKVLAGALTVVVGFAQLLNLDFADSLADPSGGARLTGLRNILVAGCESIASASSP
jgi:hypothetical protein